MVNYPIFIHFLFANESLVIKISIPAPADKNSFSLRRRFFSLSGAGRGLNFFLFVPILFIEVNNAMNIKGAGFDVNLFYTLGAAGETVPAAENPLKNGTVPPAQERRKTDSVEISGQYGEGRTSFLNELKKQLAGTLSAQPDASRLESLQGSISAGTYETDAGELARTMLQ